MSHPYYHSISSSRKFGGIWQDYIKIHDFFDETKSAFPDMRHRALRHHAEGIFWCEEKFGTVITNSDGKMVPVRAIGEQHVMEDVGFIPTIADYLKEMNQAGWMYKPGEGRKVLKEIKEEKLDYIKPEKFITFSCSKSVHVYKESSSILPRSPYMNHNSLEDAILYLQQRDFVTDVNIINE